jgi:hypothetical protein
VNMLKKISKKFPHGPLTEEKIRSWLDDIGLPKKLEGYEDPTTLFGLASDRVAFLEEVPAEEGGKILWSYLNGVKQELGKRS